MIRLTLGLLHLDDRCCFLPCIYICTAISGSFFEGFPPFYSLFPCPVLLLSPLLWQKQRERDVEYLTAFVKASLQDNEENERDVRGDSSERKSEERERKTNMTVKSFPLLSVDELSFSRCIFFPLFPPHLFLMYLSFILFVVFFRHHCVGRRKVEREIERGFCLSLSLSLSLFKSM